MTDQIDSFLVSGYEFSKLCTHIFCPRYNPYMTDTLKNLKENDFVFLNLDYANTLLMYLQRYSYLPKFNLITHNSDKSFDINYYNAFAKYTNKIYAINNTCNSSNMKTIPLGFVDTKSKPHKLLKAISEMKVDKTILAYMNFTICTNKEERQKCYDTLITKSFITSESNLPPASFYKQMRKSKYVISPDGTGYDCHRIYEAILLNAIPIIKKNPLTNFYKHLPVILVDSWDEINGDNLEKIYEENYNKLVKWKEDNPTWFTAKFWI